MIKSHVMAITGVLLELVLSGTMNLAKLFFTERFMVFLMLFHGARPCLYRSEPQAN